MDCGRCHHAKITRCSGVTTHGQAISALKGGQWARRHEPRNGEPVCRECEPKELERKEAGAKNLQRNRPPVGHGYSSLLFHLERSKQPGWWHWFQRVFGMPSLKAETAGGTCFICEAKTAAVWQSHVAKPAIRSLSLLETFQCLAFLDVHFTH